MSRPVERPISVLFVCTHNSARSIMAEALLRLHGGAAYEVTSAGIEASEVRPLTLRVLTDAGVPADGLRSASVADVADQRFDIVITVCDDAREACPTFPGEGERQHWSFPDPSRATGTEDERLATFTEVFLAIDERVRAFLASSRPAARA